MPRPSDNPGYLPDLTYENELRVENIVNSKDLKTVFKDMVVDFNNKGNNQTFQRALLQVLIGESGEENRRKVLDDFYQTLCEELEGTGWEISKVRFYRWVELKQEEKAPIPDRLSLIQCCFALKLNAMESIEFLERAAMQPAWNPRSASEMIYVYCLDRGKRFKDALKMIAFFEKNSTKDNILQKDCVRIGTRSVFFTLFGKNGKAVMWDSDEEFLEHIIQNKNRYFGNSTSLYRMYLQCKRDLCKNLLKELLKEMFDPSKELDEQFIELEYKVFNKVCIAWDKKPKKGMWKASEDSRYKKCGEVLLQKEENVDYCINTLFKVMECDNLEKFEDFFSKIFTMERFLALLLFKKTRKSQELSRIQIRVDCGNTLVPTLEHMPDLIRNMEKCIKKGEKAYTGKSLDNHVDRRFFILFQFMNYIYKVLYEYGEDNSVRVDRLDPENFIRRLNDALEKCGMSTLYVNNPWDRMITAWIYYGEKDKIKTWRDEYSPAEFTRDIFRYMAGQNEKK